MYPLRPPEDFVVEAVEEIDRWLTKCATNRAQGRQPPKPWKDHNFNLRVILAEIKRLRAKEQENENH